MLETPAIVVASKRDTALVEPAWGGGCGSGQCASGGCGAAVLAQLFSRNPRGPLEVLDPLGVGVGDYVIVGVEEGSLARASAAVYGLPLVCTLAAAVGAKFAQFPEAGTVAAALLGLGVGIWAARIVARRTARRRLPRILRRGSLV